MPWNCICLRFFSSDINEQSYWSNRKSDYYDRFRINYIRMIKFNMIGQISVCTTRTFTKKIPIGQIWKYAHFFYKSKFTTHVLLLILYKCKPFLSFKTVRNLFLNGKWTLSRFFTFFSVDSKNERFWGTLWWQLVGQYDLALILKRLPKVTW